MNRSPLGEVHSAPRRPRLSTAVACFVAFVAACTVGAGCGAPDENEPLGGDPAGEAPVATAQTVEPFVYGTDDRTDDYKTPDAWLRSLVEQSTAAIVAGASINATDPNNVKFVNMTLGAAYNLCSSEPFRDEQTVGSCSATLIDDDLVLTAGHCMFDSNNPTIDFCSDTNVIFNYYHTSATALQTITTNDIFHCSAIVASQWGTYNGRHMDWAIFRISRPATPRYTPAGMRHSALLSPLNASVAMLGFPSGISAKVSVGPVNVPDLLGDHGSFGALTDMFFGNSGSGVYQVSSASVANGEPYSVMGVESSLWLPPTPPDQAKDYVASGSCNVRKTVCGDGSCGYAVPVYADAAITGLCAVVPTSRVCQNGAPKNDLCANAEVITIEPEKQKTYYGTTVSATHNLTSNCGSTASSKDVFYKFSIAQPMIIYADTYNSQYDTVLFLAQSCTTQGTGACSDDSCSIAQSQLVQVLQPGTYYIAVSGFNGASGPYQLHVQALPAAGVNTPISGTTNITLNGSTANSTDKVSGAPCGVAGGKDVAYYWASCPSQGAGVASFSTCSGTSFDSVLRFKQGNWLAYDLCNDDSSTCATGSRQSYLAGFVSAGSGVRAVYVDGFNAAASGPFQLGIGFIY
jgi:V8-like Glu-specific endopeptidase